MKDKKPISDGILFCRLGHVDLGCLRVKNQIPSCCLPVMLSPPKLLDEIQPNSVCELHEWGVQRQTFLAPPSGALGRGQKVKFNLISITMSISKILYQSLCVLRQMKDTKHIRRNFYSIA